MPRITVGLLAHALDWIGWVGEERPGQNNESVPQMLKLPQCEIRTVCESIQANFESYFRAVLNLYCGRFGLNSRLSGRSLVAYVDSFNCGTFLACNNRPATAQIEREDQWFRGWRSS